MKKKEGTDIIYLKFKLTITLIDDLFYEIGELRSKGYFYWNIAKKMWTTQEQLSLFINWNRKFYKKVTNELLWKWLNTLKTNK